MTGAAFVFVFFGTFCIIDAQHETQLLAAGGRSSGPDLGRRLVPSDYLQWQQHRGHFIQINPRPSLG